MNKISLLILLLALTAGLVGYCAWTGEEQNLLDLADRAPGPSASLQVAPAARETAKPSRDKPPVEGLAALARRQVADQDGGRQPLVLQVWDGEEGVPAAGVEVCFLDTEDLSPLQRLYESHPADYAEAAGIRYRTGEDGRLELPRVQHWGVVVARKPGFFASQTLTRRRIAVQLVLRPDETLTVRCVNAQGEPVAGIPIGIVQTVPYRIDEKQRLDVLAREAALRAAKARAEGFLRANPTRTEEAAQRLARIADQERQIAKQRARVLRGSNRSLSPAEEERAAAEGLLSFATKEELRERGLSGADGLVVIRHFQLHRRAALPWWRPTDVGRCEAVLMMPFPERHSVRFAGEPVTKEVVELRVPPTGSIALRTVDADGRPYAHPVRGRLNVVGASPPAWSQRNVPKEEGATAIVFPCVGLGLQFVARCHLPDDEFDWVSPPFHGPTEPGQRVVVDLVVAPHAGMLSGRLVDGSGAPRAGVVASFLIRSSAGRLEGEEVATDPQGRFHLPYVLREGHGPPFRLDVRQPDPVPVAGCSRPLSALPARGVTDLGDLRLTALEAVAAGLVVNDAGEPVVGATVQLQRWREEDGEVDPQFADEAFVTARTDEAGRFQLFASLDPTRYRLQVAAPMHFDEPLTELRPGADLRIELVRWTRLAASLLPPDWLRGDHLTAVRKSSSGEGEPVVRRVHRFGDKALATFDWTRPGDYDVEIRLKGFPDPILRVERISLTGGTTDVHPRLRELDLRNSLHSFQLAAVDDAGQPVRPDWPMVAMVVRPDGRREAVGFRWQEDQIDLVSAVPQLEVWALAGGYHSVRTTVSAGRSQIQFQRIPPIEVEIPGLRQAVGDTMVWVKLFQAEGEARLPAALAGWDGRSQSLRGWFGGMKLLIHGALLGRTDRVTVPLVCDGRFRVIVYLLATGAERIAQPQAVDLGHIEVRVPAGSQPVRRTVRLDAGRVKAALAKLVAAEAAAAKRSGR